MLSGMQEWSRKASRTLASSDPGAGTAVRGLTSSDPERRVLIMHSRASALSLGVRAVLNADNRESVSSWLVDFGMTL
jgi:hypothetical protein